MNGSHGQSSHSRPARRVVVTGMGVVTSLGCEVEQVWDAVLHGRSGVRFIESFESRGLPVRIASEVDLERLPLPVPVEWAVLLSRSGRFGLCALDSAWRDANFGEEGPRRERVGVAIGASSFPTVEQDIMHSGKRLKGKDLGAEDMLALARDRPSFLAQRSIPLIGTLFAQAKRAGGPCSTVQTACSSATQALGEAFQSIRAGRADVMISGGTDSMLSLFCVVGFTLLGALARCEDPTKASRPFDAKRNGFVLGEGAGVVILEELEHALARKARIHAEIIGYASSSDGYRLTDVHPNGAGATACMLRALASASIAPSEVDYINAHGTATAQNDRIETLAIKNVFGAHTRRLLVSSTKSQLGHLVCAAGGIEFILSAMTLKTGIVPPTINLENRDPECDLDYVPGEPRQHVARIALSNSFGFGGQNGTVVLRRWDGLS